MEEAHPNWKSLPVEILHNIFQFVNTKPDKTSNLAFVCKTWTTPAQSVLYTNVHVKTLSQLEKFYNTVKQSPQLGNKVKSFTLNICFQSMDSEDHKVAMAKSFTLFSKLLSSCLPNLEELRDSTTKSYIPLLNALEDSQLKHLKSIESSRDLDNIELANYTTCAIYLKDRIERVEIMESSQFEKGTSEERLISRRLYDKLHQFKKLEQLDITKNTNEDILTLEYILDTWKALKLLSFRFSPSYIETSLTNGGVSLDTISNVDPAHNINALFAYVDIVIDYKTLLYIIRKFPKLNIFILEMNKLSPARLNRYILSKLLNYITGIETLYCFLRVDDHDISETFGNHWETAKASKNNFVSFMFTDNGISQGDPYKLEIVSRPDEYCTSFTFHITDMNQQHFDFMEKAGKFIQEFKFEIDLYDLSVKPKLPSRFMPSVLTHCPKLKKLSITQSTLDRLSQSNMDLRNKPPSLDELCLDRCKLNPRFLEQLSLILPEIKVLKLGGCIEDAIDDGPFDMDAMPEDPDIEIIMPYTKIDCITFSELNRLEEPVYLKAFAIDKGTYVYFLIDTSIKKTSEQNYLNATDCVRAYICCKSNFRIRLVVS